MSTPPTGSVRAATLEISRGVGWMYLYRWLDRLLAFVVLAVLARLLEPRDFGVVAIAASIAGIVEGLSDFQVQQALIQTRAPRRALYDTAWTLGLLRGVVASLVMLAAALVVRGAEGGALTLALCGLAVAPLLDGLANPKFVRFERELIYSRLAVQALTAKVLSLAVTVSLAVLYRSFWALVVGVLIDGLARLVLSYVFEPYRPRATLSRWRELLGFSGWMVLANLMTTLAMRTDRVIIGRFLGAVETGYYYMTQRIGVLPTAELVSPLQRVLFPSFSRLAGDPARLRSAAAEAINGVAALSLPAAFGFALVANDLVPLVLGEEWLVIVPLIWILVPFLGVRGTLSMTQPCVMATGRTKLLFVATALYAAVHLPLFVVATMRYGLRGSVVSIVVAGVFYIALNLWLLRRTAGLTVADALRQLERPLAGALSMVGVILLAGWSSPLVTFALPGSPISAAIKVLLGLLVYATVLTACWHARGRPAGIEARILELLRAFVSRHRTRS